MDNDLRRGTSTPISERVEELNKQILRDNELREKGMVGEPSKAEGFVPLASVGGKRSKKVKLQPKAKIGMLLAGASLVGLLTGVGMQPKNVGFVFDYNTQSVTISQEDPNDYTTKEYTVDTMDGAHGTLTYDELNEAVPNVDPDVQDFVSIDSTHAPVGVHRVEESSPIKGVCIIGSVAGLGAAAKLGIDAIEESKRRSHR